MTLPISLDLPFNPTSISEGGETAAENMRELKNALETSYERNVQNIDGSIKEYTPILSGATLAGTGTYTTQYGLSLRQGIRTTVWFNIAWTAHTGTGAVEISLPYKTKKTTNEVWTGSVELWNIAFPAGYTYAILKPIRDSNTMRIQMCGSGVGSTSLSVPATGLIIGSVFYIGQEGE